MHWGGHVLCHGDNNLITLTRRYSSFLWYANLQRWVAWRMKWKAHKYLSWSLLHSVEFRPLVGNHRVVWWWELHSKNIRNWELCYESSPLIFYRELSSTIFQSQSVRHRWYLTKSPLCTIFKGINAPTDPVSAIGGTKDTNFQNSMGALS